MRHHRHLASGVSGGLRAAVSAFLVAASVCGGAEDARAQPRPAPERVAAQRDGRRAAPPATPPQATPARPCVTVPVLEPEAISCGALERVFALDDSGSEAARAYLNQRASAALNRAIQLERRARAAAAVKRTENSFEMPPQWIVRSDYEIFNLIADYTGTKVIHRSYGYGTDVEEMRAFRNMTEAEETRKRATYTDVEEYVGNRNDNKVDPLFFAGGVSLTALTGVLAIVDWDEIPGLGTDTHLRPMGWPPGLRVKGHFRVP